MQLGKLLKTLVCTFSLLSIVSLSALADEGETIRVFKLEHARAEALADLIDRLSDGNLNLTFDARTNSIVMVGGEEESQAIEALLIKLDVKVEGQGHEERGTAEELEEAELREIQMMEQRERRHHAENMGEEIRRLEMKLEMTKAELEHQSKMMEIELEAAKLTVEKAHLHAKSLETQVAAGQSNPSETAAAKIEVRVHELKLREKEAELEHFKSHVAPMQMRQLQFELGLRHREMKGAAESENDQDQRAGERDR